MPQLLHFLAVDPDQPHAPEFGSIAVFSCSRSCAVHGYVEEAVFVQDAV